MTHCGKLLLSLMLSCLTFSGCIFNNTGEEPHFEKIHVLLEQEEHTGFPEASRYLYSLDEHTQYALAKKMQCDDNPLLVYLGGTLLVRQKRYDEAALIMAHLIVIGGIENDVLNRIDSDWWHEADPATWQNMLSRVGHILIVNLKAYPPENRSRAENFLVERLNLEPNKPFNRRDAISALDKLSRAIDRES